MTNIIPFFGPYIGGGAGAALGAGAPIERPAGNGGGAGAALGAAGGVGGVGGIGGAGGGEA